MAGPTDLKTLFPEPAVMRVISPRDDVNRGRRDATFPIDPQEGSR